MKTKLFCPLLFAVLGLATFASAESIPVTFTGNSSNLGGPAQGVYYYPYTLTVNGSTVTVACDDYADEVQSGESWMATEHSFSDLSGTLFDNQGAGVNNYKEAAWLYTQFQNTPPLHNNVNAAINFAIWDLFNPQAPTINNGGAGSSAYWLNLASQQNLDGFDVSQFVIYTPASGWPDQDGRPQEYLGEVPEPTTLVLMLTGLAGLMWLGWKRRLELE